MKQETILPIIYASENRLGEYGATLYGVRFLTDFGVFKKDTELVSLNVDYRLGLLSHWRVDKKIIVQRFVATPIE